MALYLEYPNRKLPPGLSPIHQTEVPAVEDAARELAQNVAVAAEQLSPTSAAECLSPRMHQEPAEVSVQTSPIQFKKKRSKSKKKTYAMGMRSQSLTGRRPVQTDQNTSPAEEKEPESILYPTRAILSPRPSNQSKRVKWPDMEAPLDDSTPKVEQPKVRANAAVDDLFESLAALGTCCGQVEMSAPATSTSDAMSDLQSQLETVYEVERNPVKGNLTVRTNLPMGKEPISTPSARDPIMSFREKKNIIGDDSIFRGSNMESRDDISSSDGEDWAPVLRPRWPSQRPPLEPEAYHPSLRESVSMQDGIREEQAVQYIQGKKQSHVSPRQVIEEISPRAMQAMEEISPRSIQVMEETQSQRIPPEQTKRPPRNLSRRSSGSVKSGTSWTLPAPPRQSRRAKSPRRKKKFGFRLCGQKQRDDGGEPHFAEIEWKTAPRVKENPFQQERRSSTVMIPASPRGAQSWDGGSMGTGTQSQASSHISEIDWKTNKGKRVAALKLMEETIKEDEETRPHVKEKSIKDARNSPQIRQVRSSFSFEVEPRHVQTSSQPKPESSARGGDRIRSSKGSRSSDTRPKSAEYVL